MEPRRRRREWLVRGKWMVRATAGVLAWPARRWDPGQSGGPAGGQLVTPLKVQLVVAKLGDEKVGSLAYTFLQHRRPEAHPSLAMEVPVPSGRPTRWSSSTAAWEQHRVRRIGAGGRPLRLHVAFEQSSLYDAGAKAAGRSEPRGHPRPPHALPHDGRLQRGSPGRPDDCERSRERIPSPVRW
jgi:hypothetical protein